MMNAVHICRQTNTVGKKKLKIVAVTKWADRTAVCLHCLFTADVGPTFFSQTVSIDCASGFVRTVPLAFTTNNVPPEVHLCRYNFTHLSCLQIILNLSHRFSRSYCKQYDRLLASQCRLSVCLSVCNVVHCGAETRSEC